MLTQEHVALYNIRLCNRDAAFSAKMFYFFISRGENQKGESDIFGEMEIYISNESS